MEILRIWGGSFHDYWFTDDAVLKVRLVPQAITLVGILVLVTLTALFEITGVIAGAILALLIYFASGRLAKRRRPSVTRMSVQELKQKGLITLRIPYSVISETYLEPKRLTISVEGRKVRIKLHPDDLQKLQTLLRSKIPDRYTFSA